MIDFQSYIYPTRLKLKSRNQSSIVTVVLMDYQLKTRHKSDPTTRSMPNHLFQRPASDRAGLRKILVSSVSKQRKGTTNCTAGAAALGRADRGSALGATSVGHGVWLDLLDVYEPVRERLVSRLWRLEPGMMKYGKGNLGGIRRRREGKKRGKHSPVYAPPKTSRSAAPLFYSGPTNSEDYITDCEQ